MASRRGEGLRERSLQQEEIVRHPGLTNAERCKLYREQQLAFDPLFKDNEKERSRINRQRFKALRTEEQAARDREMAKLRAKQYRDRKKASAEAESAVSAVKAVAAVKAPKRRHAVENQRAIWRRQKAEQRKQWSAQKWRRNREKQRQIYERKVRPSL